MCDLNLNDLMTAMARLRARLLNEADALLAKAAAISEEIERRKR